jgi:hypothetical protein
MVSVIGKKGSTHVSRRSHDRSSGTAIARVVISVMAVQLSPKERAILISAYEMSNGISLYAMSLRIGGAEAVFRSFIFEAKSGV